MSQRENLLPVFTASATDSDEVAKIGVGGDKVSHYFVCLRPFLNIRVTELNRNGISVLPTRCLIVQSKGYLVPTTHQSTSQAVVSASTTFMANENCSPQNASDLPIELKLLILENLSDDEISPLTLVWHDILPEVRARRFSHLTVKPQARFSWSADTSDSDPGGHASDHSFVAQVASSKRTQRLSRRSGSHITMSARELEAERQCERLRRLTDVLNEASEVAEYIQSLKIWERQPYRCETSKLKSPLSRSPSLPAFVATISRMSNLSHLCLHELDFYLFHEPHGIHRALRQCHITSLQVKSCRLNMSILLAMLYAVVNLDVLRLEDLHLNPGFGDDYNEHSENITDFDVVETWKNSKSAFLCVDELHMTLKTRDDWLLFDLLLSKKYSPLYDVRAFSMIYELMHRSQIDPGLYIDRISRFIERNDLEGLHLGSWDSDVILLPLQHIGAVQTLELGLPLTHTWQPHSTQLSWCIQTLTNIGQTSCLASLTLTFEIAQLNQYLEMPSTSSRAWEALDRALLDLDLEDLSLLVPLTFVNRYIDFTNQEVFGVEEQREYKMQMKSKIQTWFLESCLPESGKQYFGCDDPSENIGTFTFEWNSKCVAKDSPSIRLEAPSL
ncbi:hypothetical protein CPB85DRAFT_1258532 [Mucidula mucida]|nr:hypothetical protein CPB85DRAFT_1258532 [Mucidula mucida]